MKLAREGKLRNEKVRRAQVERMLRDPKGDRFVKHFTGQWLGLRDIEFTSPDKSFTVPSPPMNPGEFKSNQYRSESPLPN